MGARKTVILKITILRHLSDRVGNNNEKNDVESHVICTPFTGHPVEGVLLCGTHMSIKGNV